MKKAKIAGNREELRNIPSVDILLSSGAAQALVARFGRAQVARGIRETLTSLRERMKDGRLTVKGNDEALSERSIVKSTEETIARIHAKGLCRVINATGIILHTGLGRAVLPKAALDAVLSEHRGYSLLEVDRESGKRGSRDIHIVKLLREITGAEDGAVVNNNAGATLIALNTVAKGGEVIVSRGQLVEIGGSFRIPDVMEASGARLVEVGTTNRTSIGDFESAINEKTSAILRVHTSNFRIVGFTETPSLAELVELGKKRRLPVIDDLGSGALFDLRKFAIHDEPIVQESIRHGAEIAMFSGDKLVGGPQAGMIVGKRATISRIKKNPLYRALRVDKLSLTALEATLKLFLNRDTLVESHPTFRMISADKKTLRLKAEGMLRSLEEIGGLRAKISEGSSEIGGGSVPALSIPTIVLSIRCDGLSANDFADRLRMSSTPIFARKADDAVHFDMRTLQEGEELETIDAIRRIIKTTIEQKGN